MSKTEAYKIVYDDLCNCDLLCGKYDAKNGKKEFMYGILTVMENIAYNVSEETYDIFSETFIKNILESEEKYDV